MTEEIKEGDIITFNQSEWNQFSAAAIRRRFMGVVVSVTYEGFLRVKWDGMKSIDSLSKRLVKKVPEHWIKKEATLKGASDKLVSK